MNIITHGTHKMIDHWQISQQIVALCKYIHSRVYKSTPPQIESPFLIIDSTCLVWPEFADYDGAIYTRRGSNHLRNIFIVMLSFFPIIFSFIFRITINIPVYLTIKTVAILRNVIANPVT